VGSYGEDREVEGADSLVFLAGGLSLSDG
jgi:hypothetical protein